MLETWIEAEGPIHNVPMVQWIILHTLWDLGIQTTTIPLQPISVATLSFKAFMAFYPIILYICLHTLSKLKLMYCPGQALMHFYSAQSSSFSPG